MKRRNRFALSLIAAVIAVGQCFPVCPGNGYDVKEHAGYCNDVITGRAFSFEEAVKECEEKFGEQATLPTIHNQADNDFYMKQALGATWIGLVYNEADAQWHWMDNSAVDFTNWNNPNDTHPPENFTCAAMNNALNMDKGEWLAVECQKRDPQVKRRLICKSREVYPKWREFEGYEYFANFSARPLDGGVMEKGNVTWSQARGQCMKMGGDLLSVLTDAERDKIIEWLSDSRPDMKGRRLWIGMYTLGSSSWQWSDGMEAPLKYWGPDFPLDTYTGAKCVYQLRNGRWHNSNCGIKQNAFICKRRKGSTAPITEPPPLDTQGFCPAGYYSISNNRCYKTILSDPITWTEASTRCREEPGFLPDLASIHNKLETTYLAAHLTEPGQELWLGGNNLLEGRWGWSDTSPFVYEHFLSTINQIEERRWIWVANKTDERAAGTNGRVKAHGEEDGPLKPKGECLTVGAKDVELGRWLTADCGVKKAGYVCQTHKDPDHIIMTPMPQPVPCPNNFKPYHKHCYYLEERKVNWTEAYGICRKNMASLVTIENEAENNAVFIEVLKLTEEEGKDARIWTGYQDLQNTKQYEWIDGNPSNYTQWSHGQPKRWQNGGCVVIREGSIYQEGGVWVDKPCTNLYPALCKRYKAGPSSNSGAHHQPTVTGLMSVASILILLFLPAHTSSSHHQLID